MTLKTKAPYILAVTTTFFFFQLFLLINSFPAEYRILTYPENRTFWVLVWQSSELIGEVGLILRFTGACFFVAFAAFFLKKREISVSILRKAVLLEGIYYLFNIPFIVYLFTRPPSPSAAQTVYYETAISYTVQAILVSSTFLLLYFKTDHPNVEYNQLVKWSAIGSVAFVFALWVKHFLFNLYALPISLENPILVLGLLNSTFTMLIASLILLFSFLPIIRGKTRNINFRAAGISLVLVTIYFIIYISIALEISTYMNFLMLTEYWTIALGILGITLLVKRESKLNSG